MVSNPEFVRNIRTQLTTGKMITAVMVAAALSMVVAFSLTHISAPASGPSGWGFMFLRGLFWMQALILAAGGGISCVNAIYKEKDQNTFDFQRVTRLSPLELTLGKLLGAPIFLYFLCLCFVPLVIFAAVKGRQSFTFVLAAYAVLFIGSLTVHAFALLISLLTVRGSHTAAIIVILIALWFFSNIFTLTSSYLHLGPLSPFYSAEVSAQVAPMPATVFLDGGNQPTTVRSDRSETVDVFFGRSVPHLPVLLVIDTLFICWFLLALARNIKRDPTQYELYSPLQTFVLTIFINGILLAFVNWRVSLFDVQASLLTINMAILSSLGLAQLRNRDRTRRILRSRKENIPSWLDFTWPAPFLFIAAITAGLLVSISAATAHHAETAWSPAFAIFRCLFVAAWLVRDMQFLQWMMLRRGNRPLAMGVLWLSVFYGCVWIVLSSFGTFRDVDHLPFTAFFLPTPVYYLDHAAWTMRPAIWGGAFVAQFLMIALFIYAQRQAILELAHPPTVEPIPTAINATSPL
jgi:hypothetical protein